MQFSGILVTVRPGEIARVADRLEATAGVEVYLRHAASGRIVVVQEAADVEAHEALLRGIQALPGVISADLVCHVVDAGPEPAEPGGRSAARVR